ncbi:FtsK/SpoIIIE domain-containing protein [Pseudonocardia sp. GCM10023141]|uniref:FtsK/SpoIIIE domain-containing protein n=1 Tax=Pseudonocardia sp. GCM10023141 TaxID=3252653 RepID=UPI0036218DAC
MSTTDESNDRQTARPGLHGRRPTPGPRINLSKTPVNLSKTDPTKLPGWIVDAAASGEYEHLVDGQVVEGQVVDGAVVEGQVVEGEIVDAEIVDDTPTKPGTAVALRDAGRVAGRQTVHLITTAVTHPHTKTTAKAVIRHLWYPVAGTGVVVRAWRDTHGASRYERMMRQAELAGDREALLEWEARDVAEKDRRHGRVMDWIASPIAFLKALTVGIVAFTGLLLVLGIILAVGTKDVSQVLGPIIGVINLVVFVAWFLATYGALMLTLATAGGLAYVWNLGRTRTEAPAWAAPAQEVAGRDVIPDERAITNALKNLNLPAINRKFKEGWAPRWELPPVHDGKGWHSQFLLPEGVTVEMIVDRKSVLAHNLLRLPVEVWPTEPRDRPGMLDLWVADPGSLTKPVAPWPLLKTGRADFFKGVPVGVDPRGNPIIARPFGTNMGVAGMMGSGKSTLIITYLLGLMLDPLVDIDVYCMAQNADYDPLKPRLRTLFKSDDPDEIPAVLDALKALMSDLSQRGRKLSLAGEPKLTRALAEADPVMRPRVVVIDECQELFVSAVGDEAAELVEKMVAKARKYGVHMIFATPVPSADSLPRKVAKVLSNKACFAIGDHQGNDAILGTGKHKAGITATTLRPLTTAGNGTVDPGDIGTCMAVGFTPTDGLMRCFYVQRGNGVDDVTPVVQRALALRAEAGVTTTATADEGEPVVVLDPLADIATVLVGHDRMRTQEVLTALAARNPAAYGKWTFTDLKNALPESAQPYKTQGVQQLSAHRVAEALADRDGTTDNDLDDEDVETD